MKLTLRDFLWLLLVGAIGLAWLVDHRRLEPPAREALAVQKALKEELRLTTEKMNEARAIARLQLKVLKDCGHEPYIIGHDWLLEDFEQR